MCSRFDANSSGRTILAPGNKYTNRLVYDDILFNPIPQLDEYGGHMSSAPGTTLDCSFRRRPQYSFKFACNSGNCGPGGCNCFDPAAMKWQMASMGAPRENVRFDTFR
jgi:hypothetical protein